MWPYVGNTYTHLSIVLPVNENPVTCYSVHTVTPLLVCCLNLFCISHPSVPCSVLHARHCSAVLVQSCARWHPKVNRAPAFSPCPQTPSYPRRNCGLEAMRGEAHHMIPTAHHLEVALQRRQRRREQLARGQRPEALSVAIPRHHYDLIKQ